MKHLASLLLSLMLVGWLSSTAVGQLHFSETAEQTSTKITLHPMGESRPALAHRLLPTMPDLIPGNAAVHYGKVTAEQIRLFSNDEKWNQINQWSSTPLEELRRDDALKQLRFVIVYDQLRRASRCKTCDWQLPLGRENSFSILLPEVQQLRQFARFLSARARAEIAEGKYEDAIQTLQIGYALGLHAAAGETLVNGLVGIAICAVMSRQTLELIQQPDAPNLYWALTRFPRPVIDLRPAAEAEMMAVAWSFPELQNAENSTHDADYWRQTLKGFGTTFGQLAGGLPGQLTTRPEVLAAFCMKAYPASKRALILEGMDPERVEAMPVAQVVVIHSMRAYDELRDDTFKWFYVSFPEGYQGALKADRQLSMRNLETIPLAVMLLPAVRACQSATARCDREIALLRTLEALRLYGASHDGRLPESLDDVTEVPIPQDPYTGRPFKYTLQGDTALLEGPEGPSPPGLVLRLEIRFAR